MSDYKPGKMDISVQTETFGGFIKGIIYVCVFCFDILEAFVQEYFDVFLEGHFYCLLYILTDGHSLPLRSILILKIHSL